MAQVIEINDGDTVNVIEVQLPFYGIASSELEFGARAAEAITVGNVVYVSGATGTHIQVSKAQANAEATSSGTIGIAKESAATNGDLQVVTFGILSNLNTQAYTAGQVLYLSSSVAGGYQTTLPAAPNHGVKLGWVVRSHPSQGQIFVAIQNYQELEELSDVSVAGVTDGQVLTYQSSSGTWVPSTPNPGDITAVNVTSPITGGGTGGDVTIGLNQSALSLTASQISDGSTTWARLAAANTFTVGGHLITNSVASDIGLIIRGHASQSVPIFAVQSSDATNRLRVTSANAVVANGITANSDNTVTIAGATTWNTGGHLISNSAAATIPLIMRGAASQSAALMQFQISDGTVRAAFNQNGFLAVGGASPIGNITSFAFGATQIPMVARGAASQTANLQEWQSSAGSILAGVTAFGSGMFGGNSALGASLGVQTAGNAAQIGAVIRGAASQTANLLEIQNSASSILARVQSNGRVYSTGFFTNASQGFLYEENSGGTLVIKRQTAAAGRNGTDFLQLYVRTGTNAGTLKLVVSAGASGAETTILDNIPQ